jgi:large conductance mechanosensitive channel
MAGKVDFSKAEYVLRPGVEAVKGTDGKIITEAIPATAIRYGAFITHVINFVILAFCIFLVVKLFNAARRRFEAEPAPAAAAPTKDQLLLTEIRDLLAARR